MRPDTSTPCSTQIGLFLIWIRWIRGCSSCSFNVPSSSRFILLNMFCTSSFNASLSFFVLALVIDLIGTSNGSLTWLRLVLGWSSSISGEGEIFNKSLIKTSQTMKTSCLCDWHKCRPFLNSPYVFLIHINTFCANNITNKDNFLHAKVIFFRLKYKYSFHKTSNN